MEMGSGSVLGCFGLVVPQFSTVEEEIDSV